MSEEMREEKPEEMPQAAPASRLSADWIVAFPVLAAALIGGVIGAGLAIVVGFDIVNGFVGGGIILAIILPLMTLLLSWHGEWIAWAFQVFVLLPIGSGIGAVVAIVVGFDIVHGVVGGGIVASILPIFVWVGGFWGQP